MKRYLLAILIFFFAFIEANSTHLVGGFISYEYIGRVGNSNNFRYRVTLTIYRDCDKGQAGYDDPLRLCIYSRADNSLVRTEYVRNPTVTPVKPVGNTSCPELFNVCLEKGVYQTFVDVPQSNHGYIFEYVRCCRNEQVNLPNGTNNEPMYGQTYKAVVPPTYITNSSPYFNETPVPYICLNDTTQVRNSAIDPDGDSLVYKFVHPYAGGSLVAGGAAPDCKHTYTEPLKVGYKNGYSFTAPFGANGHVSIDQYNGLLELMSRQPGNFVIAIDVEEYRGGAFLSATRLDLQIHVIQCPENRTPYLSQGSKPFTRIVEAGAELCFNITAVDTDNDNLTFKAFGDMFTGANGWQGNKATLANKSGKTTVSSQFCWETQCLHAREVPYVFTVEVVDDGCPSKFINQNYYIIVNPFISDIVISGPTPVCQFFTHNYSVSNRKPNSTLLWEVEGGRIVSGQGTSSVAIFWEEGNKTHQIKVTETSQYGCKGETKIFSVEVIEAPPPPKILGKDTVCFKESFNLQAQGEGGTYRWFLNNFSTVAHTGTEFSYQAPAKGNYKVGLIEINSLGCPSDTTVLMVHFEYPETLPIIGPPTICPNNIDIEFWVDGTPGSTYFWDIYGGVQTSGGNGPRILTAWGALNPNAYVKVLEINKRGCVGDTVTALVDVGYDLIIDPPIGDTSVCEFTDSVFYYMFPPVNNSWYTWDVTGGDNISGQDSPTIYINWGVAGQGNVSVMQTAWDSVEQMYCRSRWTDLPVSIWPLPTADEIEGIFEICQFEDSLIYTLNGFPGSTYEWEVNGATNLTGQGTKTIKYPTATHGNFIISVFETTEKGCTNFIVDSSFVIHPKPLTTPIKGPAILCHPNFLNIEYSVIGYERSVFEWLINGGIPVTPSDTSIINIDWEGKQNNFIWALETSEFGCIGDTMKLNVFIDNIQIDMRVVTVNPPPGDDKSMIIKWEAINAPRYDTLFVIEKRTHNSGNAFHKIGDVGPNEREFIEQNINTDLHPFDYQVRGFDLCRQEFLTPVHTNINLKGKKPQPYEVEMDFTPYLGWEFGVNNYMVLRKLVNAAPFYDYEYLTSPVRIFYENGLEHYTQCYRIRGEEMSGREEKTFSNEICFNFDPLIYIPNAFSPNGDGMNDFFVPFTGALKTYHIRIFNRWGEKLFESDNREVNWDGTFRGSKVEQGVYIYVINYTGFDDKAYDTKGTVTLLR